MSTGICSFSEWRLCWLLGDSSAWAASQITLRSQVTLRLWQCSDDFVHVHRQFIEVGLFAEVDCQNFPFGLVLSRFKFVCLVGLGLGMSSSGYP